MVEHDLHTIFIRLLNGSMYGLVRLVRSCTIKHDINIWSRRLVFELYPNLPIRECFCLEINLF